MKWLITFLHNDASWEEVLVDERRLSAAFRRATALECPCHVLEVKEVPYESLMYCWTEDGDPECCTAKGAVFHGEECHHCARPIEGTGVALTSPEGEVYPLHAECAYKGCAGFDRDVIAAAVAEAEPDTRDVKHERRWRVTFLRGDGKWVPVEVKASSEAGAVEVALAIDWVENIVECEPLATLLEEVQVEPEGGDPVHAVALAEVGGARRWVVNGDPEEDWWAEVGEAGRHLPGDWEYDRDEGIVVCSIVPARM